MDTINIQNVTQEIKGELRLAEVGKVDHAQTAIYKLKVCSRAAHCQSIRPRSPFDLETKSLVNARIDPAMDDHSFPYRLSHGSWPLLVGHSGSVKEFHCHHVEIKTM